jgi:hypothetical protein
VSKKDKYYLKKYGIDENGYQAILRYQDGVCKICKRPPGKIRLAVDHLHKVKVTIKPNPFFDVYESDEIKSLIKYTGEADVAGETFICFGATKIATKKYLEKMYKKYTVRGLLCSQCNRALGKVEDPRWQWGVKELRAAADYLETYNGKGS